MAIVNFSPSVHRRAIHPNALPVLISCMMYGAIEDDFDYVHVRGIAIVKNLKWRNVIQRRDYFVTLSVFKCIHGILPSYLSALHNYDEFVKCAAFRVVNRTGHRAISDDTASLTNYIWFCLNDNVVKHSRLQFGVVGLGDVGVPVFSVTISANRVGVAAITTPLQTPRVLSRSNQSGGVSRDKTFCRWIGHVIQSSLLARH